MAKSGIREGARHEGAGALKVHERLLSRLKCTAGALLLSISVNGHAALIDHGSYFTDTVSGLDWLKLTETVGRSFDDVFANLGAGGDLEGWNYARYDTYEQLFRNQGLLPSPPCQNPPITEYTYCGPVSGDLEILDNLVELFGDLGERYTRGIQTSTYHGYNYGMLGELEFETRVVRARLSSTTDSVDSWTGLLDMDYSGNQVTGSFLLRSSAESVPAPATPFLLFFGLALVALGRRSLR